MSLYPAQLQVGAVNLYPMAFSVIGNVSLYPTQYFNNNAVNLYPTQVSQGSVNLYPTTYNNAVDINNIQHNQQGQ